MNLKYIDVQFEGGHARLAFRKQGDNWVCAMPEQTMSDLQSWLSGKAPDKPVSWTDLNGFDNS